MTWMNVWNQPLRKNHGYENLTNVAALCLWLWRGSGMWRVKLLVMKWWHAWTRPLEKQMVQWSRCQMIYLHIHSEYSQHPAFTYPHTIPSLPKLCENGVATTQWWDCETALFDRDGRCLRCLNTWRCCKGGLRHSGWFPEAWWVWTWNLEIRKIGWK